MKTPDRWIPIALLVFLLTVAILVPLSRAQVSKISTPGNSVTVGASYHNDTSPPLRDIKQLPVEAGLEREANPNPRLPRHHVDRPDQSIQDQPAAATNIPGTALNFDGIPFPGVACNCAPPDTNGEVGATQYVQIVNEGYQVFNKATGASVLGPSGIATLWSGFGGVCQNNGSGDPVVIYDQIANRWIISQFAGVSVPTDECVAVSTTSDATGSYNRYAFHLGSNFFDYPKLSVWPDAYYMSMNVFNSSGTAFLGPQPFAFNRAAMLAGNPATFVTTGITGGSGEDSYLPADLDGSALPPAGAPATFVEWPGTGAYRIFHFHPDFTVPSNTTFTLFASVPAAPFTELCPATRACVPQLGTTSRLDGIGDRLMFRLAYRNFGSSESVVGNFSVSSGGVSGIRWFELNNVTAGPVTVYQESTYQPDTSWRWMGSAAQDSQGNLAIGFSTSSSGIFPQIRYAGRLATDPLNTLAQGEAHLFDGTGSQTGTVNRWGDYSDLTVDPVDDCTFWYTQEYYATTGQFNWRTRIGSFKFAQCGGAGGTPTPTPTGTSTPAVTSTPTRTNTPTNTPTPTPTRTSTPTATPSTSRILSALSPAMVFVGLASSADTGLKLDLKAEALVNGGVVGTGELDGVNSPTGDFKSNMLDTITLALTGGPVPLSAGDQLQMRVSARRSCSGGGQVQSGTARLWYNGAAIDKGARADAGSRFDATIGSNSDYFLRTGFALSTTVGSARTFIDEALDSSVPCPNRPFTPFGTWSITP